MSLNCSSMAAVDDEDNAVSTYVAVTEPLIRLVSHSM